MKPAARRPLLLCALAAAATLSFLLVAPPPLAAHLSSLLLAFPASPYAARPKLLFLLAGQSNMAGRGLAPSPLPPPFRPHPRVLRLAASRRWVVAAPPLHADIDTHKACGLGPAMPFAHRILHDAGGGEPPLVLGLVPSAVGGTRIWMWAKGEPLYEAAVARARAALDAGGGTLAAVLWFQGESDTIELEDATAYGGRMERLVNDLRADLGIPNLLVIQEEPMHVSLTKTMEKLTPLLLLLLLVIVTSSDEVLLSVEADGALVCDIVFQKCLGSCWKSGNCMRCCKHHGFIHGRCSLKHGDACYCCHTPDRSTTNK